MNSKKQQLIGLGLLLTCATIFGVIALTKQVTTTPNYASANEVAEATVVESVSSSQEQLETEETSSPIVEETTLAETQNTQETEQPVEEAQPTPMTLTLAGTVIPYQNGGANGQAVIDSDVYGTASTFGGATVQSGNDGLNTHFIGHNPGIFSAIFNLVYGDQIVVTDANGIETTYTVSQIVEVDDYGYGLQDGADYYDVITGTGGGERITLQGCITDTTNLIVIATA